MTSVIGNDKKKTPAYFSSPLGREPKSGFTLIEIVLALMILSLILAISIPSLATYFEEQRLRSSMHQFELLIQEARHLAMTTQKPYRLHFTEKKVELFDHSVSEKENRDPVDTESWISGVQLREKTEESPARYIMPEDWIFSSQGLCAPLRFRFTLQKSWMEFSIHPLDGTFQKLEFKIE